MISLSLTDDGRPCLEFTISSRPAGIDSKLLKSFAEQAASGALVCQPAGEPVKCDDGTELTTYQIRVQ
ncbi:hypothetical protein [Arsenicibacter rosenii]|nr:hypothetical protein [Arsenicibacter rosenii]